MGRKKTPDSGVLDRKGSPIRVRGTSLRVGIPFRREREGGSRTPRDMKRQKVQDGRGVWIRRGSEGLGSQEPNPKNKPTKKKKNYFVEILHAQHTVSIFGLRGVNSYFAYGSSSTPTWVLLPPDLSSRGRWTVSGCWEELANWLTRGLCLTGGIGVSERCSKKKCFKTL